MSSKLLVKAIVYVSFSSYLITELNAFSPCRSVGGSMKNDLMSRTIYRRLAAREICSFDESDFALPTGEWPYTDGDLNRLDNSNDSDFYDSPRFVTHIDDNAIESLTEFYRQEIDEVVKRKNGGKVDILDLCSSWISHLPQDRSDTYGMVAGVGMNEEELAANKQLFVHYRQDINVNPSLSQFADESFDLVCNVVSVDYLTNPKEVFEETYRVLRPGGAALISFSNRCFASKAVAMWLQADDIGRLTIVGSYYHYSAKWSQIQALDIKRPPVDVPKRPSFQDMFSNPSKGFAWASTAAAVAKTNSGDPMFVVKGVK
uniref:Methyltransferase type 11 domain-containing protein n=1 Tax=Eucampia antarctica TaxID=49252 RepID=A0A7S2RNP2_9STRA|mmetsp:Transcript_24733/g.23755  ORF Transcript_24733/g.23755 Transcript_24733/m.23755 type:complete len:316 (+) Transcript_24733:17-964(+)